MTFDSHYWCSLKILSSFLFLGNNQVKEIVQAYHEEAEWFHKRQVPTFDEYMDIAMVTSGFPKLLVFSLLGMEDVAGIEEFQWIQSKPKCLKALQTIARLADDLKTIEVL